MELQFLTLNRLGEVRTEYLGGQEYLVAEATSIVPGVLPGSKGSLYYPPDQIENSTSQWDDIPLVVYHPIHNGQHVSAKFPGILEKQGVGFIRKSQYKGKLQHECWFNANDTKRVDRRVYDNLRNRKPIELSTGLFTENEEAPIGANWQGRSYTHIARNYKPDHLAILPDQVGACSLNDGCGVLINKKKSEKCMTGEATDCKCMEGENTAPTDNAKKLPAGGKWVTIGHTPVYIDKGGKMVTGPKALKDAVGHKGDKKGTDSKGPTAKSPAKGSAKPTAKKTASKATVEDDPDESKPAVSIKGAFSKSLLPPASKGKKPVLDDPDESKPAVSVEGAFTKSLLPPAKKSPPPFKDAADKKRFEGVSKRQDAKESRQEIAEGGRISKSVQDAFKTPLLPADAKIATGKQEMGSLLPNGSELPSSFFSGKKATRNQSRMDGTGQFLHTGIKPGIKQTTSAVARGFRTGTVSLLPQPDRDNDPNTIDALGGTQIDDHQDTSHSPANLFKKSKKVGI